MSYIQNYGFTKSIIRNNKQDINNEIKWEGDYDGNMANINIGMNNNGKSELVSVKLDNNDLRQLFGIQPVEMSLEKRIINDFDYNPVVLEGALFENKRRLYNKTNKRLPCHKRKSACHKRKSACHKRKSPCHKQKSPCHKQKSPCHPCRKRKSPCTKRNH
jgi:hypothetical protein